MKLCGILFYHPKNPQNLADIATLAAHKRIPLVVVKRPGTALPGRQQLPPRAQVEFVERIQQVEDIISVNALYVVLETYGLSYVHELELGADVECVVLVVGAEDYGIPEEVVGELPGEKIIAKIPVSVQGMSYNVVVSTAIGLYELEKRVNA